MENVKNLIRKQNRNMKHVHDFIIATGFLYMNYVTKIKSLPVRTLFIVYKYRFRPTSGHPQGRSL